MERLASEKAEFESQLARPGLAGEQFAEIGRNLAHVQAELAVLEERWLDLHSRIDAMTAEG
jgi:ATP-binding cassette subfamily F protein 3